MASEPVRCQFVLVSLYDCKCEELDDVGEPVRAIEIPAGTIARSKLFANIDGVGQDDTTIIPITEFEIGDTESWVASYRFSVTPSQFNEELASQLVQAHNVRNPALVLKIGF